LVFHNFHWPFICLQKLLKIVRLIVHRVKLFSHPLQQLNCISISLKWYAWVFDWLFRALFELFKLLNTFCWISSFSISHKYKWNFLFNGMLSYQFANLFKNILKVCGSSRIINEITLNLIRIFVNYFFINMYSLIKC
jgi:hypothetical protein